MKKLPIILFLIGISIYSFAQNYQILISNNMKLFSVDEEGKDFVKSAFIDSVKLNGSDSIFYLNKELDQVDWNTYYAYGNSFLGAQVIIKDNGYNIIINDVGDSLKINTMAKQGDSWPLYSKADTQVVASVLETKEESFHGITDSVKTIDLQYKIADLNEDNDLNEVTLKLSKNHGWIEVTNFNHFPYLAKRIDRWSSIIHTNYLEPHILWGQTAPKIGNQNHTMRTLKNYCIGSQFHYSTSINSSLGCRCLNIYHEQTRDSIMNLNWSDDTLIYQIRRIKWFKSETETGIDSAITESIYEYKVHESQLNSTVAPYILYNDLEYSSYGYHSMSEPNSKHFLNQELFGDEDGYLYEPVLGCSFSKPTTYIEGIFDNGYNGRWESCGETFGRSLVYISACGIEEGEKLTIGIGSKNINQFEFSVSPNPSNGTIKIQLDKEADLKLSVFDNVGRVIFESDFSGQSGFIDLKSFSEGIYSIVLNDLSSGKQSSQKVVLK